MQRVFRALRAFAIVVREREAAAAAVAMAMAAEVEIAEAGQMQRAAEHYRKRLLALVLSAWTRRARTLRAALHQQCTSSAHYRRVTLRRAFHAWADFCARRISVYAAVARFEVD